MPYLMSDLKKELSSANVSTLRTTTQLEAAQLAINEAQKASNDDTKSSAGDKYETGREMAQQETNRNLAQLNEANKLKVALNQIGPAVISERSRTGKPGDYRRWKLLYCNKRGNNNAK